MISEFGDQAAFALLLLAKIASKTERRQKAIEAFKQALKLNPFLWSCYESLCNMGEKLNPNTVFQLSELESLNYCHGSNLSNVESIYIPNSMPISQDNQMIITTPHQVLTVTNTPGLNNSNSTPIHTPEDSSSTYQPFMMSGLGLLPCKKVLPARFRNDSVNTVSMIAS